MSDKASCTSAKESLSTESLRLSSLGRGENHRGNESLQRSRSSPQFVPQVLPQVYDVPYFSNQVNLLQLGSG